MWRKKKGKGLCKSVAGSGTNHPGYGRCKYCGGASTGPKSKEGIQKASQNSRKHGLYAQYLSSEEQAIYEELKSKKDLTLFDEISLAKTKLTSYLQYVHSLEIEKGKKGLISYKYKGDKVTKYEMGTIQDPDIHKTLEQIRRLVATSKSIDMPDEFSILDQINAELRAASKAQSDNSWNGEPQYRKEE